MKTWVELNFKKAEFACPCGCEMPAAVEQNCLAVANELQVLRDVLGKPVRVNSAYRCPTHNAAVGGKSKSYHMTGQAADVQSIAGPGEYLRGVTEHLIKIKRMKNGGVGTYTSGKRSNLMHYDLGPINRRWRE